MSELETIFPKLNTMQIRRLEYFVELLRMYNKKVNLVSRKREDFIDTDHVLPSLALSLVIDFAAGASVMDLGTGGGFPGIPLAIAFPSVEFLLVDSIGKKIQAVETFARELKLDNVRTHCGRAESLSSVVVDFVVGRAVTALPNFASLARRLIRSGSSSSLENGVLYLSGGEVDKKRIFGFSAPTSWTLDALTGGHLSRDKCIIFMAKQRDK